MLEYIRELGRGSAGTVKENTEGDAVKIMVNPKPYRLLSSTLNEITVAQMNISPYILHAKSICVNSEETHLIMPKAESDLRALLLEDRLVDRELFFFRLGLGIAALHNNGIVHSDLKASNILVFPEEKPVIADFGSIHWIYNECGRNFTKGTYTYSAPEVLLGEKISPKSDVWSFGVLLAVSVMKRRLFDNSNNAEETSNSILAVIKSRLPLVVPNPDIAPVSGVRSLDKLLSSFNLDTNLEALIRRCLTREEERPTIFEVLTDPYFDKIQLERPTQLNEVKVKELHSSSIHFVPQFSTINLFRVSNYVWEYELTNGAFLIAVDLLYKLLSVLENKDILLFSHEYTYIAVIIAASYYGITISDDKVPEKLFKRFTQLVGYKFIPSPFLDSQDCILPYNVKLLDFLVNNKEYPKWSNKERRENFYS